MRVLHVIPSMSASHGGPTEVVRQLLPELRANGIDATLLTTSSEMSADDTRTATELGGLVLRGRRIGRLTVAPELRAHLGGIVSQSDVVHVHGVYNGVTTATLWACRRRGVPVVLQPHGALSARTDSRLKRAYRRLDETASPLVHAVIASSRTEYDDLTGFARSPRLIVPLGVAPEVFSDPEPPERPSGPLRILYLSRLTRRKGLDTLIHAVGLLPADLRWELRVCGPDARDLDFDPRALAAELGVADRVAFLGRVEGSTRLRMLHDSDVFVLPSEFESFGLSAAEAMSAGLATLLTRTVGVADEAAAMQAAVIVERNPASIATEIERLARDVDARRRLSASARAYARSHFSWAETARRATAVYEQAVA